ncbi:MAG: hypothetical protein C4293_01210 [Nitrospiraceae bacterium]
MKPLSKETQASAGLIKEVLATGQFYDEYHQPDRTGRPCPLIVASKLSVASWFDTAFAERMGVVVLAQDWSAIVNRLACGQRMDFQAVSALPALAGVLARAS